MEYLTKGNLRMGVRKVTRTGRPIKQTLPPEKLDCFVISPIGDPSSPERIHADTVFEKIIEPAMGLNDFDPNRIDQRNPNAGGSIPEQVGRALREAPLCVAVLTGLNPNVMFEVGVRHAWDLAILHLIEVGNRLPFDISDRDTIFYSLQSEETIKSAVNYLSVSIATIRMRILEATNGQIPRFCDVFAESMRSLGRRHALDAVFEGKKHAMVVLIEDLNRIKRELRSEIVRGNPGQSLKTFAEQLDRSSRDLATRVDVFKNLARTQQKTASPRKKCDPLLERMNGLQSDVDGLMTFLERAGSDLDGYRNADSLVEGIIEKADLIRQDCVWP